MGNEVGSLPEGQYAPIPGPGDAQKHASKSTQRGGHTRLRAARMPRRVHDPMTPHPPTSRRGPDLLATSQRQAHEAARRPIFMNCLPPAGYEQTARSSTPAVRGLRRARTPPVKAVMINADGRRPDVAAAPLRSAHIRTAFALVLLLRAECERKRVRERAGRRPA